MDRRKFLLGVGSASIGGSAILGSGAFSRVESNRGVTIAVAEDPDAYLGLDECDTIHGDNYVDIDDNGHLSVDISTNPNGGEGVNSNSQTWFDDVFQICNQGKQDACVWIENDGWPIVDEGEHQGEPRVDFYLEDDADSILGADNAQEIGLGECYCVGIRTNTHGIDATDGAGLLDDLGDSITLVADVNCPDAEPEAPPECIEPAVTTWDEIGDEEESGGPVILMGLDSEQGAGSSGHGPPQDHAAMVASLLDDVTNGGDGILVLGADSGDYVTYWEGDIGSDPNVDEPVTFVAGADDILEVDFDGFAMIGVATDGAQGPFGGLTDDENEAIAERSGDIAAFVNDGGGLLGKTQETLENPWGYVDPFGDFESISMGFGDQYESVIVTDEGTDLGLTQEGMSGWCCYHEVFPSFPDFFDVLIEHNDESTNPDHVGEAAAIGGGQVIVQREVSLEITGKEAIGTGESASYDVEVENRGEESINATFDIDVISGGSISTTVPESIEIGDGESEAWESALEVSCDGDGEIEIEVGLIGNDGVELVTVTVDIDCIPDDPGIC